MQHRAQAWTPETNLFKPIKLAPTDRISLRLDGEGKDFNVRIYSTGNRIPSFEAYSKWISRVPERKRLMDNCNWHMAATDYTVEIIAALWPREQIVFLDEQTQITFDYHLLNARKYNQNAEVYAQFKQRLTTKNRYRHMQCTEFGWEEYQPPLYKRKYELHPEHTLSDYQQVAMHNGYDSDGYADFMEQGTGKTAIVIGHVNNKAIDLKEDRMYRCIILCPKNVRLNWRAEFAKFSTRKVKVTVLRGGQLRRMEQLADALTNDNNYDASVVVAGYKSAINTWEAMQMFEWDLAVLDESHYIKWPETERAKFAMKLRERSKQRICLTGTPITNTPLDLYSQLEFLGEGFSGFKNWKAFRKFYGVYRKNEETGYNKLVSIQNLPFMRERLARYTFMIRKSEALPDLPEKLYDVIEVEMNKRQSEIYVQLRDQLAAEIDAELSSMEASGKRSIIINNMLVKLLRLAQITSGFVTYDPVVCEESGEVLQPKEVEALTPNGKIEELVKVLKEKEPTSKTQVWACWIPDIEAISARLTAEGIKHVAYYGGTSDAERELAEERFNCDPEYRVFVGNPAAGGTGLNLLGFDPNNPQDYETNCDHVIYFSQNWSMVHRSQSEDRSHRRGTRVHVRISDLCVPGTIDEEIRARVLAKKKMALEVSDIRDILNTVLKGIG